MSRKKKSPTNRANLIGYWLDTTGPAEPAEPDDLEELGEGITELEFDHERQEERRQDFLAGDESETW